MKLHVVYDNEIIKQYEIRVIANNDSLIPKGKYF